MPNAVKNINSYASLAEALDWLGGSIRASSWESVDEDNQARALISATRMLDRQCLKGVKSSNRVVLSIAIVSGGAGYEENDVVALLGGTFGEGAMAEVVEVDGGGAVTAIQLTNAGSYQVEPTSPVATTTSVSGTGLTLTVTFTDQVMNFGRDGDTFIPVAVTYGIIELAYELSVDPSLEGSNSTATNIKRAKAGSAEVEFFRPGGAFGTDGSTTFPAIVQSYLGQFLCGAGQSLVGGGYASGTGAPSQFDDCDGADVIEALP